MHHLILFSHHCHILIICNKIREGVRKTNREWERMRVKTNFTQFPVKIQYNLNKKFSLLNSENGSNWNFTHTHTHNNFNWKYFDSIFCKFNQPVWFNFIYFECLESTHTHLHTHTQCTLSYFRICSYFWNFEYFQRLFLCLMFFNKIFGSNIFVREQGISSKYWLFVTLANKQTHTPYAIRMLLPWAFVHRINSIYIYWMTISVSNVLKEKKGKEKKLKATLKFEKKSTSIHIVVSTKH